ncbi:dihydrofolate reductase [Mycoplasmoides pneumoniae]|uniref:dihydrofolate reductase n=1 Tax=Mycoplasmoides pneumoniae TaxID=2104 RepID=UPI000A29ED25|nr:dihydrofolate reductase [Mycoplasmoides pneumoniae]ARQ33777.1 dihydrofolate reductase [Mycoplasmoides pneumoniae]
MVKAIWAMDQNGLIGNGNSLPWRIKAELQHFRQTTLHQDVLMGSATYLSLPSVFSERNVYILTRNLNFNPPDKGCLTKVIHEYENFIQPYLHHPDKHLYICGGAQVYEQLIPRCDALIVSTIFGKYTGDKYLKVDFSPFELTKEISFAEFKVAYYHKIAR